MDIRVEGADLRLYLNLSLLKEAIIGTCSSLSRYVYSFHRPTETHPGLSIVDPSRESLDRHVEPGVASTGSSCWIWPGSRGHVDLTCYLLFFQSTFQLHIS